MALPDLLANRLTVPAVAAPMFLISGPDLVVETCRAGVVGTFPALNQRTSEGYADWLDEIGERLSVPADAAPAPFGVNMVVHRSNPRLEADLAITIDREVPLVITSLGLNRDLIQAVHGYGGLIFHDVTNLKHAEKAADAGVDGLIAVTFGAGGHAGPINPFAALQEMRAIFPGTLLLGGAISTGAQIAAARLMGADLAYVGTRFMATKESLAVPRQKQMLIDAQSADIIYTPAISGVPGNFLKASIEAAGRDPGDLSPPSSFDFGTTEAKAWKNIWAAGQGVGAIDNIPGTKDLCERLSREYRSALAVASTGLTEGLRQISG
jgi:nitronate monooxygenase